MTKVYAALCAVVACAVLMSIALTLAWFVGSYPIPTWSVYAFAVLGFSLVLIAVLVSRVAENRDAG